MSCIREIDVAFSREDLKKYESQPQKTVDDKVNPFRGATPAKTASAAEAAAPRGGESRILDVAPAGAAAVTDDTPVVDEDGTIGDPTESGEGTSDATSASSTGIDDPGTVADPNADLTGGAVKEEPAAAAPAKGSAQERIVELNDKLEGAMVFGKAMQEQYKAALEENARLKATGISASAAAPAAAPPVNDDPGPMPDMADQDIQFDTDKYRAKMAEWSSKNARKEARAIVREMTGAAQANTLVEQVNKKVEAYSAEHPEFADVVTNNPVLRANQLAPDAGLAVARSPYTAELLMRFGNDPAFAVRVAKMHPAEQLMVIGEMVAEIKVEKKAAGTTKTTTAPTTKSTTATSGGAQPAARKSVSQAPPPPRATPAGGRAHTLDPLDPNLSMDDFVRSHRSAKQSAREQNRKQRGLS